jgi:ribonuclease PH
MKKMERIDKRQHNELRNIKITRNFIRHPQGSVLIEMGDTKVICTAIVEDRVPPFLKNSGKGWISSEYSMLPGSTHTRKQRESTRGRVDGRTMEIQRLIGRSLRSVVDLDKLGERTIWIDCDVIQADGGTRTASITGSCVALIDALRWMKEQNMLQELPIKNFVAAISVGIVEQTPMVDLAYEEDSKAEVDMNIVMTDDLRFIEVQGTGEERAFSKEEFSKLQSLAEDAIKELIKVQKEVLGEL